MLFPEIRLQSPVQGPPGVVSLMPPMRLPAAFVDDALHVLRRDADRAGDVGADVVAAHQRVVAVEVEQHAGFEVGRGGDEVAVAVAGAAGALAAADTVAVAAEHLDAEALVGHRHRAGDVGADAAAEHPHLVGVDEDAVVGEVVDHQVADDRAKAGRRDGDAVAAADRRRAAAVQLDALAVLDGAVDGDGLR